MSQFFIRTGLALFSSAGLGGCSFLFGVDAPLEASDAGDISDIDAAELDGDIGSTGGLVAEYHFDELVSEAGRVWVRDSSGLEPRLDLAFGVGDHELVQHACQNDSVYLAFPSDLDIRLGTPTQPQRLLDACADSNELTVEAWIRPADINQFGPARIVSLSPSPSTEAFLLGQSASQLSVRVRGSSTTSFETPSILTANELRYVAFTAAQGVIQVWDGELIVEDNDYAGDFSSWAGIDGLQLNVANVPTDSRRWAGELHYVAVYCSKLPAEELTAHASAGVPADPPGARAALCEPATF